MTDYPRIVRGFYYMADMHPGLYVIETGGRGTAGDGDVIREADGRPKFMCLEDAQKHLKGEQASVKQALPTDIFRHLDELALTDRIQIVAPGINGKNHYDHLDPECFTIIVNKACEIPGIRRDLWMVADPTPYHALVRGYIDWFAEGLKTCESIGCFNSLTMLEYFDKVKYTHEWAGEIFDEFIEPMKNHIRGGLTISGMAVQMAYWLGAKDIVLCGVDLSGMYYFDGSERGTAAQHHTAWVRILPLFQQLVDWVQARGVKVYSLSETALNVERIQTWQQEVTRS